MRCRLCTRDNDARYVLDTSPPSLSCALCAMSHPGRSVRLSDVPGDGLRELIEECERHLRDYETTLQARVAVAATYYTCGVTYPETAIAHNIEDANEMSRRSR